LIRIVREGKLTKAEMELARARCEAASKAPWHYMTWPSGHGTLFAEGDAPHQNPHPKDLERSQDWEFAAHARTDLPKALDMLERAARIIEYVSGLKNFG